MENLDNFLDYNESRDAWVASVIIPGGGPLKKCWFYKFILFFEKKNTGRCLPNAFFLTRNSVWKS